MHIKANGNNEKVIAIISYCYVIFNLFEHLFNANNVTKK